MKIAKKGIEIALVATIVSCGVLLAMSLFGVGRRSGPRMEIESAQKDFGRLEEGEKRTAKFSIFNSGKGLLTVDRVEPG